MILSTAGSRFQIIKAYLRQCKNSDQKDGKSVWKKKGDQNLIIFQFHKNVRGAQRLLIIVYMQVLNSSHEIAILF